MITTYQQRLEQDLNIAGTEGWPHGACIMADTRMTQRYGLRQAHVRAL
jgi:hypothetical protein